MRREKVIIGRKASGFFVPNVDFIIWLKAPSEIIAWRIASREGITYDEALSTMKNRERSEHKRYERH